MYIYIKNVTVKFFTLTVAGYLLMPKRKLFTSLAVADDSIKNPSVEIARERNSRRQSYTENAFLEAIENNKIKLIQFLLKKKSFPITFLILHLNMPSNTTN